MLLLALACAGEDSTRKDPVDTADTGVDSGGESAGDTGDSPEDTAFAWDVCDWPNAPYDNVQDAADAAVDGATLTICAGTFEGATLTDRDLSLVGVGGDETLLTGDGFTALKVYGGAVALTDLALTGVSDGEIGAALHIDGGSVTLDRVAIRDHAEPRVVTQLGGSSTWNACSIEDNAYPLDEADPASLVRVEEGAIDLVATDIARNTAWIGVYAYGGQLRAWNTLFAENTVGPAGVLVAGGDGEEEHLVHNSVFVDNVLDEDPYASLIQAFFTDVRNSILLRNQGGGYLVYGGATVEYDLTWENDATATWTGEGNLDADPLLDAVLSPGAGSPAIDAGDPDPNFDDPDATRADLGLYGGPLARELP